MLLFVFPGSITVVTAQEKSSTETGSIAVEIFPGVHFPLFGSRDILKTSYSTDINISFTPLTIDILSPFIETGYEYLPTKSSVTASRPFVGLGLGFSIKLNKGFSVPLKLSGGYAYSFINSSADSVSDNSAYARVSAGIRYSGGKTFSGTVLAGYENYFGLNQGMYVQLGGAVSLPVYRRHKQQIRQNGINSIIQLVEVNINPVLPILRTYYDNVPIGTISIVNITDQTLNNFSTEVFIPRYMDSPKKVEIEEELQPRGKIKLPIYALMNEEILLITEGTKAPAEISILYDGNSTGYADSLVETIEILNRNAIIWDDDQKAAAFVTSKDPDIRSISSMISSFSTRTEGEALDENLKKALSTYQVLENFGLEYIRDPQTPYADFSGNRIAVDYVQFPRQTLEYGGGDCDDLSILYNAVLESMGVETAFITIPGHIYTAVKLSEDTIPAGFGEERIIPREDGVWIPVEITTLGRGFLEGWKEGSVEWNSNAHDRFIFTTRDAWKVYAPVALPGSGNSMESADKETLLTAVENELNSLKSTMTASLISSIPENLIETDPVRYWNRAGIINAKYGLYERARNDFEKALAAGGAYRTLFNSGKLALLMNDTERSVDYFEKASLEKPDEYTVLAALYTAYRENGDLTRSEEIADQLRELNPDLAYTITGDSNGVRGSNRMAGEVIEWVENQPD